MRTDALMATLPDLSARLMRDVLRSELQIDWSRFCDASRIKPLHLDTGALEILAQEELLLQQGFFASTANRPTLWFDIGLRYRAAGYGSFGIAMMTAPTLGEALHIACKYQALTYSLIDYRFVTAPNGSCALIGGDEALTDPFRDFTQHRDLGAIRTLLQDVIGAEIPLELVSVAAAAPAGWDKLSAMFPCRVEFDAPQTRWQFRPGAAQTPVVLADRTLLSFYSAKCDALLECASATVTVAQRLARMLDMEDGWFPSLKDAARRLAMSERTLHRRLADEGTTLTAVVEAARYRKARQLLAQRKATVDSIAFAVGFSDPSSFSRAFKRWSGTSAQDYRRAIRTAGQ
ncbi:MAG: AraC family transcriptional regulator ligand-binding domain-containing protein [Pseudomonadota bacterium]